MASGFTWGHMIRKRMGLPPLFLLPSYFPPVFPLFEQSQFLSYLDCTLATVYNRRMDHAR